MVEISFEGSKEIVSRPTVSGLKNNLWNSDALSQWPFISCSLWRSVQLVVGGGRYGRVFYTQSTEVQAPSVLWLCHLQQVTSEAPWHYPGSTGGSPLNCLDGRGTSLFTSHSQELIIWSLLLSAQGLGSVYLGAQKRKCIWKISG